MDIAPQDFHIEQDVEDEGPPSTLDIDIDVTFQKKRFTTLHLEEPTGKAIERATLELNTKEPTAYTMTRYKTSLIAAVAGVPREVVLEMKASEIERAFDFLDNLRVVASQRDGAI